MIAIPSFTASELYCIIDEITNAKKEYVKSSETYPHASDKAITDEFDSILQKLENWHKSYNGYFRAATAIINSSKENQL